MTKKCRVKLRGVKSSKSCCLFLKVTVHRLYKRRSIRSYSHMCHFSSHFPTSATVSHTFSHSVYQPTFADRGVSCGQRNGSPRPLISVFWTGAATFYSSSSSLTSPTGGGRSVGIVRLRTKATELVSY